MVILHTQSETDLVCLPTQRMMLTLIKNCVHICDLHLIWFSWEWRYNERDGVSNRRRIDCLLNPLFKRRSKKTSTLHVTGFYEGKSSVTGELPTQRTRVGVTKAPFVNFSVSKIFNLAKHISDYLNHIYVWQVPPQLNCCDTCQI